jgi:hypothetical protein
MYSILTLFLVQIDLFFQADIHNHVVMSAERSLPDVLPRQVSFPVLGSDWI